MAKSGGVETIRLEALSEFGSADWKYQIVTCALHSVIDPLTSRLGAIGCRRLGQSGLK